MEEVNFDNTQGVKLLTGGCIYAPIEYNDENIRKVMGIYQIRNKINGKIYVGSSKNLKARKFEHFWMLRDDKHHSIKLQNSYNKYGKENFIFEVIEIVEDINLLLKCEQYWIDTLNSYKNGYNICKNAGNTLGYRHTLETRKKMSESHKNPPPEIRERQRQNRLGFKHSLETCKKISKNSKKLWLNPDFRKRMKKVQEQLWSDPEYRKRASERVTGEKNPMYGKKASPEARLKMSIAHKRLGCTLTEDGRRRISEVHKGKIVSQETREKLRQASLGKFKGEDNGMYGKHHTEETKRKISERFKGEYTYGDNPNAKKVICLDTLEVFDTIKRCAEHFGVHIDTVRKSCVKIYKNPKIKFMFYEDYLKEQNIDNQ